MVPWARALRAGRELWMSVGRQELDEVLFEVNSRCLRRWTKEIPAELHSAARSFRSPKRSRSGSRLGSRPMNRL